MTAKESTAMKTKEELDAIVYAVIPFDGPLVIPIIELVGEHRRLQALLHAAVRSIQAYGENEGYMPNKVLGDIKVLEEAGFL